MLQRTDEVILERVEKFSHWFQRLTGLTNFWLARWMMVGFLLILPLWAVTMRAASVGVAFQTLILGCAGMMQWSHCVTMDHYYSNAPCAAHPGSLRFRELFWSLRLFVLLVTVALISHEFWEVSFLRSVRILSWLCLPGHLYFMGVIPLPPGRSKVTEFIERIVASIQSHPLPETA